MYVMLKKKCMKCQILTLNFLSRGHILPDRTNGRLTDENKSCPFTKFVIRWEFVDVLTK